MTFLQAIKQTPASSDDGIQTGQDPIFTHPVKSVLAMSRRGLLGVVGIQIALPLLMFWVFLTRSEHFSVDSYLNWFFMDCDVHLRNSRPVSWAIACLEDAMGFSPLRHTTVSTLLFMVFLALAGTVLSCMIVSASKKETSVAYAAGVSLAVSLSFANMFIWEWYTFVESLPWYAAGVAFAVASVGPLLRRGWKPFVVAIGLVSLVTMTYQIIMPMAGIWAVTIVLVSNGCVVTAKTVREGIRCVVGCATGAIVGIAIPHLMEMAGLCSLSRGGEITTDMLIGNAKELIRFQDFLWVDGLGLFPKWSLVVFVMLVTASLIYGFWRSGRDLRLLPGLLLSLFGCYAFAICLHLAVDVFYPAPRTLVPVACFWSTLLVCAWAVCYECGDGANPSHHPGAIQSWVPASVVCVVCVAVLVTNAHVCWGATHDHLRANDSDGEWGRAVAEEIAGYEEMTGNEVTTIVYGNDASPTYDTVPPVRYSAYGINIRAVPVSWATPYVIEYYGNRRFESMLPMDEETSARLFGKGRNDVEFARNQVAFEGDTAYVLVY